MKHVYFLTLTQRQGQWNVHGLRYMYFDSLKKALEEYKSWHERCPDDISPVQEGWIPDT